MAVIPLRFLNAYLFSINPMKVAEDQMVELANGEKVSVREKLIRYQSECTVALHDYWMHGMAINTRVNPSDIRTERKLGPVTYSRGRIERVLPKFMDYAASIGQPLERGILMQVGRHQEQSRKQRSRARQNRIFRSTAQRRWTTPPTTWGR